MPPKKFGWGGYHSRVIQKKKKILDPYLGILPESNNSNSKARTQQGQVQGQLPYTPDQYYALRRMQLQMSLLNINILKKRGTSFSSLLILLLLSLLLLTLLTTF
jgi:hypothetical protein